LPNHVPLVVALEPDVRQATILKRVIRDHVHADLIVVDSRDATISAVNDRLPDVILLTALLSPRDEAEISAHLRTLSGAEHLQTHTIPQLASETQDGEPVTAQSGLLGKLRRKKASEPIPGCDPVAFGEEISNFLARAAELRALAAASPKPSPRVAAASAKASSAFAAESANENSDESSASEPGSESAWADPFAWRPRDSSAQRKPAQKKPSAPREPLVTAQPLAVIAEEEEQRLADEARRAGEVA